VTQAPGFPLKTEASLSFQLTASSTLFFFPTPARTCIKALFGLDPPYLIALLFVPVLSAVPPPEQEMNPPFFLALKEEHLPFTTLFLLSRQGLFFLENISSSFCNSEANLFPFSGRLSLSRPPPHLFQVIEDASFPYGIAGLASPSRDGDAYPSFCVRQRWRDPPPLTVFVFFLSKAIPPILLGCKASPLLSLWFSARSTPFSNRDKVNRFSFQTPIKPTPRFLIYLRCAPLFSSRDCAPAPPLFPVNF